ncbi:MAG: hypothetical protein IJD97_07940 [Clostridia bacterium]|nr:hypothetical protein [Clostridia bacterium]
MKKILCLIIALITIITLAMPTLNVFADNMAISYVTDKATVKKMAELIKKQNFTGIVSESKVINDINHIVYNSKYAAFEQKKFNYPNSGNYVYSINDGVYNVSINGSKGCMAYSNYVEALVYGKHGGRKYHTESAGKLTEGGIRSFFLKEAQAGEHIRIDNTHSMTYISGDDTGFYYTNYTNDGKKTVELCYVTYEEFARYYNSVSSYEQSSIWLYHTNTNVNDLNASAQTDNGCKHIAYNDKGYCKKCGKEYRINLKSMAPTSYSAVKDKTPVRNRPYAANKITKYLSKGQKVTVVAYGYNSYGNFWYKTNDGSWIYSENVIEVNSGNNLKINTLSHTGLTNNSVRLNAECSYIGTRPTEVGVYLGTTPSNMSVYSRDTINFSRNPFNIWYDISGLNAGATYYYRFYAIVNGKEIAGDKKLFVTGGGKATNGISDPLSELGVTVTLSPASKITTTTARVNGGCSYTGARPTEVGLKIGYAQNALVKVASDKINFSKNPFDIWYDLTDLKANTKYYYVLYAIVNGAEVVSDTGAFTTAKGTTSQAVAALHQANLNLTVNAVTNLTATTAKVNASCSYTGTRPTEVGLYIGTDSGNLKKHSSDVINFSKNPFDIWYELTGLKAGTTYYYKIYAIVGGNTVWSTQKSFTTAKGTTSQAIAALPAANTRIGIVTGTNGDNLAINDKAAASPKYSNEIGVIPPGAQMTVYPDKAVGNWYYVTYNGISGYAYGKYITFK